MSKMSSRLTYPMTRRTAVRLIGTLPWMAGGLLAACSTTPAGAHVASSPTIPAALAPGDTLDHFIAQQAAQDQFSGTLLVARGEQVTLERAYGWANQARHLPNRFETIYALASITKSFTAAAILQLAERGKLTLQDHLGMHLGGFPPAIANAVTIDQLLNHTSGMGDYTQTPQFLSEKSSWTSAAQTMTGLLDIIRQQPLLFPPGTRYSYSDSGYVTLGGIVQQVAGQSYYDYIRQHIFRVAGMTQSDFYTRPQREQNALIAHPYSRRTESNPNAPRIDVSGTQDFIGGPDGGAYATVEDMLHYSRALQAYRLLDQTSTNLLLFGKSTPPSGKAPDRSVNGGAAGIATNLLMFPTLGWTVVILSNYDPGQSFADLVAEAEKLVAQA
ncbi:MAG TPA: serine hydrolase domain-containing protein [Ktedonobacteraceae bacterium]|jgi:CubicO group peptidase (beta-lactamase class C family)|nr:serine hydrolase domain-containing protein [Ktedonobacteraceae bacterium]